MHGTQKGNGPYQGPSGTNGEITGHKGMRIKILLVLSYRRFL
jgi:hypothetical protein